MSHFDKGPSFLIIGAMKCATSTLHAQLGAQPGIYTTDFKEPNFFGADETHDRGIEWYESLFAAAPPSSPRGESSTHYTKRDEFPHACERIHRYAPDLRLVYVMRHPMARLVSHYLHEWTEGTISIPLDRAILEHPPLTLQSCYAWQLAPYLQRFGPDQVLPVFFERLVRDPNVELQRIARHLGCSASVFWKEELGTMNRSADRRRRDPLRELLRKLPGRSMIARALPDALRLRIERRWRIVEPIALSDETEERLARIFDRDLARLGRWLGQPLSCDTYEEMVLDRPLGWSSDAKEAA